MTPREIRQAMKLSIDQAAVYAGVSSPTLRLYEISQDAPRSDKRIALDAYYQGLAERLATPPTAASPQRRGAP